MKTLKLGAFYLLAATLGAAEVPAPEQATVVLVAGAAGEADYESGFAEQVRRWEAAITRAGAKGITIGREAVGGEGNVADHDQLQRALAAELTGAGELWVVLIGHGTFDGKEAKFNLRGPDLTAGELALWLKECRRPLVVINTASASAPFIGQLAGPNRVVVTATRTGKEQNVTRFGGFLAEAMGEERTDLDQDGQTSLLEACLSASARVREFYKNEGRLATEHALLDDNGDGLGTPLEWFRGTRATKKARDGATLDGTRARQFHLVPNLDEQRLTPEQRTRRDELEQAVEALRETKAGLDEADYYRQLETLLLELARFVVPRGDADDKT